jgi:hypothetical protein
MFMDLANPTRADTIPVHADTIPVPGKLVAARLLLVQLPVVTVM